jgi:hypothetical protein
MIIKLWVPLGVLSASFCDIVKISHLIMTDRFSNYMKLQVSAKMKIRPGMLEGFKSQASCNLLLNFLMQLFSAHRVVQFYALSPLLIFLKSS